MGLWDTLKPHANAQFLEIAEWLDDSKDTIVWRFPVFNQAITDNSKLVVREGQAAVFVSEGKLSDVFAPGTYTLDTRNTPILSFFTSIAYKLNYPYKGDIYFISTRQFTDQKWGTPNPIMLRDAEFGPVRIRGFGIYSYKISDPATFIRQIVGTDGNFTTDEIAGQLKKKLQSALADTIGASRLPVLDLAANYLSLGDGLRDRMNPAFQSGYGITLTDFTIENISLPEEVEKALDTRTKMGVLGNLDAYTKLKAADAIETAAKNPGLGGAGIGMGVGFGMGNMMGNVMGNAFGGAPGVGGAGGPPPLPGAARFHYSGPSGQSEGSAQDVAGRIVANRAADHLVWQAGWPAWKKWSEVPEIAALVPPATDAAVRFHYHGPGGSGEKDLADVIALVKADPAGAHHVWQKGWADWRPANEVAAIQTALASAPPPPPGGPPAPPPPPR